MVIADIKLEPVKLAGCNGNLVGAVNLIRVGNENFSTGEGIIFLQKRKRKSPLGWHGKLESVIMAMPGKRRNRIIKHVMSEYADAGNVKLLFGQHHPVLRIEIVIMPDWKRIHNSPPDKACI